MRGIGKSFLGVRVLSGVDLEVTAGEVHAVVGENGAGKSTLMKIICGVHAPDEGTIEIDGRPVSFGHPLEARRAGITIIHQEFNLLPERTVAENVFLGREPVRRGLVDRVAMEEATAGLLDELGVGSFGPRDAVKRLPVAQQQIVEIVKALSVHPRLLVMDEPSAALAGHEVELLYRLIGRLRDRGVAVVYISHRLREVFDLADRVTVLKDGARVTTRPIGEVTPGELIRLMVGRDLGAYYPPRSTGTGEVRLSLRAAGNHKLRDIDLELRAGEIVGIAGLQGSGRSELAKAIFGAEPFTSGEMTPARPRSVREGVALGIGLVTEDRKAEGLALRQSVRDNALLAARAVGAGNRGGVGGLLGRVGLPPARREQEVRFLSGGNQQKVVLVKWMTMAPRVLLFDEPTRGVDVGAKAAIHELMRELANDGLAIMMISSELPELIGMSDRVVVLRDGRVAGTLPAGAAEEAIMRLAAGEVG
ncbi:sugar ABC transporter ATP-binding protein [Nonomuraea gerenzanensis]|uniref:Ribose ABC transport system, ATP-binding protein RbsA (TC 3.A.1.2.1) n=2 Tax=Nonomuraea gerenzanensis TaxID=93944 RepID=A0A1M4EDZ0_9ACTN|nr:sugar ABC transporter ATP-binding protein [Nonomuraea gerenzanensis]UBU18946.1 sugar ABC transporter ATP-binding protein [Nonomuraea gerenzanensis]SBO96793.1 Ribose ABC transport system, ATP-binding protein RbsA (TC 3.A.1.2.1) [Nonomuraea gerenzanensis]